MSNSDLAQIIEENLAPSEGWWKGDTQEVIEEAAFMLLDSGWDQPAVTEFLSNIIYAMREEYGE